MILVQLWPPLNSRIQVMVRGVYLDQKNTQKHTIMEKLDFKLMSI